MAITKVTVGEILYTKIMEEEKSEGGGGKSKGSKRMFHIEAKEKSGRTKPR